MKLTHLIAKLLLSCCVLLIRLGAAEVIRPHNLDYLDVETMEYFLSAPKEDFDVAVLFYAQWCNNCHKFAPLWDQIGRIHKAGTEQSKLIMGLFDCEADATHSQLCTKAGVKHYPTITFLSLSGQKFSLRKPRHGTQFGGNWQYGDAVYDWIKTMSALSQWHRLGWGKKLRSLFFGKRTKAKEKPLPLGIPTTSSRSVTTATKGSTDGSKTTLATSSAASETKIQELQTKVQEYSDLVVRSSTFLDAILFPLTTGSYVIETDNNKNATDVYSLLADTDGWNSTENIDLILRSCAMELALDYCTRLSTYITNDWVTKQVGLEVLTEEVVTAFSNHLAQALPESEPYCMLIEDCILSDFEKEECRPDHCPFKDPAACRYLSACLATDIQEEYAKALKLVSSNVDTLTSENSSGASNATTATSSSSSSSTSKGGWGLKA